MKPLWYISLIHKSTSAIIVSTKITDCFVCEISLSDTAQNGRHWYRDLERLKSDLCAVLEPEDGYLSLQTTFLKCYHRKWLQSLEMNDQRIIKSRKQNFTDHSSLFHLAWLYTFQLLSRFSSLQFNFFLFFFLLLFHFPFAYATTANDDEENDTSCSSNYVILVFGPDATGLAF